jgi:hypothetical protein
MSPHIKTRARLNKSAEINMLGLTQIIYIARRDSDKSACDGCSSSKTLTKGDIICQMIFMRLCEGKLLQATAAEPNFLPLGLYSQLTGIVCAPFRYIKFNGTVQFAHCQRGARAAYNAKFKPIECMLAKQAHPSSNCELCKEMYK